MNTAKKIITDLLRQADINVNGDKPWDIHVHQENFYNRVLRNPSLGLGESYMDVWWDCKHIDEFLFRVLRVGANQAIAITPHQWLRILFFRLFNYQSTRRAFQVGEQHYDLGNDLFSVMLDSKMNYSCAYWKDAENLEQAQFNKLDLICRKLLLQPGMRLLDIGCGWGAMAQHAAKHYGVEVVGVTISKEQAKLAQERCQGLPVTIRLEDYRKLNQSFDRIVSIGMFEHVGYKNYQHYFDVAHRCLVDDGLFVLHSIGNNQSAYGGDEWSSKYIFPNGMLPSIAQIGTAIEDKFIMEDWHNLSVHYDKTLIAWHDNFIRQWPQLSAQYDERFYRMWTYYLLSSAAAFRARYIQVWQVVLSKNGLLTGYEGIR